MQNSRAKAILDLIVFCPFISQDCRVGKKLLTSFSSTFGRQNFDKIIEIQSPQHVFQTAQSGR